MSGPTTRSRAVEAIPVLTGTWSSWHDSTPGTKSVSTAPIGPVYGTQTTVSEGHPFGLVKRGEFIGDIGGDFRTTRQYVEIGKKVPNQAIQVWYPGDGRWHLYEGPVFALPDGMALSIPSFFPPTLESSDEELDEAGTVAIARCKPTNSVADVSTALGELLKEGLPSAIGSSLWRDKTKGLLGKGASEFLNLEFGWKPLVRDVRKFADAVARADAVLAQYERDAGRLVRRRYDFPVEKEVTTGVSVAGVYPLINPRPIPILWGSPKGDIYRTREKVQRKWFSGAFTYAMPSSNLTRENMASFARHADKLYGVSLTPEVLWNLSPWSWAADWVSNAGEVTSNLSDYSLHGLLLRYGYIMEHTVVRDTYTFWRTNTNNVHVNPTSLTFVTETKVRKRATPFGFGLTWEGFSPLQMAILAAVGITRR